MLKEIKKDNLTVKIFKTRDEMGACAANEAAECIRKLLSEKDEINMIFAAAPSQNETLAGLVAAEGIDWGRINAFHMDEYVGLSKDAPQGFGNFLKAAIFDKVPFKSVNYIPATKDIEKACEEYTKLLRDNPVDVVLMGIGENGHIAFNDPPVANFCDEVMIKKVALDEICRMQQVHDGCFPTLDDVPKYALTLTVPALAAGKYQFCVVPAATKANAVKNTVNGDINEKCPATILRTLENATLFCDNDSGALIK